MKIFPLTETGIQKASVLFQDASGEIKETLILSALQGIMGNMMGDDPEDPSAVRATTGDFAFFAGNPAAKGAKILVQSVQAPIICAISGYSTEQAAWERLFIDQYPAIQKTERYAIKKEQKVFDLEKLNGYLTLLPENFSIVPIDAHWFTACRKLPWACDLVSCFADTKEYAEKGLGFLILNEAKEPVAGASSYSSYKGGIEIEIDTRTDYRRRKLALIVGARLILACLERGLYPSWDAANLASVALSEKLGYHLDHPYTAWYLPALDSDGGAKVQPEMNNETASK